MIGELRETGNGGLQDVIESQQCCRGHVFGALAERKEVGGSMEEGGGLEGVCGAEGGDQFGEDLRKQNRRARKSLVLQVS
ncbi:unnamed protein product [Dibothriocephalus latus]|uniref:Uncharacterized protein n=1 Tax=Dibothriocephalus latus TaxID=60516 RepID=A0A3P7LYY5_DIBLA|nr:unnamed protein product [Dibothriocephalus latus]